MIYNDCIFKYWYSVSINILKTYNDYNTISLYLVLFSSTDKQTNNSNYIFSIFVTNWITIDLTSESMSGCY